MTCRMGENPGLLGQVLPTFLATLAASKEEIIWYFMHTPDVCMPPRVHAQSVIAGLVSGSDAKYRLVFFSRFLGTQCRCPLPNDEVKTK